MSIIQKSLRKGTTLVRIPCKYWLQFFQSRNQAEKARQQFERDNGFSVDEIFLKNGFAKDDKQWCAPWVPVWKMVADRGLSPTNILEVGSFRGGSTVCLATLFPEAELTCVDSWGEGWGDTFKEEASVYTEELHKERLDAEAEFDSHTKAFSERIRKMKTNSVVALEQLQREGAEFDYIYIDGSHFEDDVLIDSILAWRLLKKGGLLVWDDYTLAVSAGFGTHTPMPAVNWLLRRYAQQCEVEFVGGQLTVRKK